jgi:hypothetical protein
MPHGSQLCRPSLGGAVVAIVLTACGSSPAAQVTSPARPSTTTTAAAVARSPQPYQLYTHCGIEGTMTLLSPAEAVFRDHAGHQVQFRLRPGATAFKHLCS